MPGGVLWSDEELALVARGIALGWSIQETQAALEDVALRQRSYTSIANRRTKPEVKQRAERMRAEMLAGEKEFPEIRSKPPPAEYQADRMWERAKVETRIAIEYQQHRHKAEVIFQTPRPIGLAFISDQHISQSGPVNLDRMEADAELIRDTPGLHAVLGGDGVDNHCLDAETEVLTQSGWVRFDQVEARRDVCVGMGADGKAFWQPIERVFVEPEYRGAMLHTRSERIDMMVTPGHRVLCKHGNTHSDAASRAFQYECARDMNGKRWIPIAAPGCNPEEVGVTDDEIRLVAWILTDGWVTMDRRNGNPIYRIGQRESNAGAVAEVLDRMGYEYGRYTKQVEAGGEIGGLVVATAEPLITFGIRANHRERLKQLLPEKTGVLPSWVSGLSDRQFRVLLHSLIDGDGSNNGPRSWVMYGKREFLESLQVECVLHGISARLMEVKGRNEVRLSILDRDLQQVQFWDKSTTTVAYEGAVWCLTVPFGNFLVRRSGRPFFTGNCKHRSAMVNSGSIPGKEWGLYDHYLGLFGRKIAGMCSGNHDDWTHDLAAVDMVKILADRQRIFYAPDFVVLTVKLRADADDPGVDYVVKVRHQYRFNSTLNQTHSVKRMWEMDEDDFDIGVVCHRHEAAFEPFVKHGEIRLAMRPGSYQHMTGYSRRYGFGWATPTCPTAILFPGSKYMMGFWDVRQAASYLTWLRQDWPATARPFRLEAAS